MVDTRRLLVDAAYPLEHNGSAKITACIAATPDFGRTVVSPLAMLWSKRSDGGHHDTVSAGETVFTCACRHHKETGF